MKTKLFLTLFVLLLIATGAGGTYYFYTKYQAAEAKLNNPDMIAAEEVKELTNKISTFMALPDGEDPQVATVLDISKLADQPFFARAENGDRVLIYAKAMKAILYRPSSNKVIEVAPISISQPTNEGLDTGIEPTATPKPTPEPTEEPSNPETDN